MKREIDRSSRNPRTAAETVSHGASARELQTYFGLSLLVLIWAANFSVVKAALHDLSPLAFNGLRFALASLVLLLLMRGRSVPMERRHWPALIALGVLGNTVYQILFIFGLDLTLAGNSSLMLSMTPVFATLLSVAFRQERVGQTAWAGVALSFVGIALVVWGGTKAVRFAADTIRGDLTTLAAALAWATFTVGSSPLVRRYGALPVTAVTMWIGGVGLLAVSVPSFVAQNWGAVRPLSWVALIYSGVFAIAVAYFLWYNSIRQIGTTRTAAYTNLIPIVALTIAWLTLGEVPTWPQIAGAVGILGGVVLVRMGRIEGPVPSQHPAE